MKLATNVILASPADKANFQLEGIERLPDHKHFIRTELIGYVTDAQLDILKAMSQRGERCVELVPPPPPKELGFDDSKAGVEHLKYAILTNREHFNVELLEELERRITSDIAQRYEALIEERVRDTVAQRLEAPQADLAQERVELARRTTQVRIAAEKLKAKEDRMRLEELQAKEDRMRLEELGADLSKALDNLLTRAHELREELRLETDEEELDDLLYDSGEYDADTESSDDWGSDTDPGSYWDVVP